MKPVRLDAEAADELAAAHSWYEKQVRGLGDDLIAAVDNVLERIERKPRRFAFALGIVGKLEVRRVVLRGFPFSIFFVELDDEVRVLAIAHQRRRPGYWRKRARSYLAH